MRYLRRKVPRACLLHDELKLPRLARVQVGADTEPNMRSACSRKEATIFHSHSMRKFAAACGDGRANATEVGNQIASCKTINDCRM